MIAALLGALSSAVMAIIGRLIGAQAMEELLSILLVRGAEAIARETQNTVDDELAAFLKRQLERGKN